LVPPAGVALLVLVALEGGGLGKVGVVVNVLGDVVIAVEEPGDVDGCVLLVAGVLLGVDEACSGSHFLTVGVGLTVPVTVPPGELALSARGAPPAATEARLCGAIAALTISAPVVESKIPPAMRPVDTGRTRAKHM
jgi:hypothetical protein